MRLFLRVALCAICVRALLALFLVQTLDACEGWYHHKQDIMSEQKPGGGGEVPGRAVQPSSYPRRESGPSREKQPMKTVPAPGTPVSEEELKRLKREAELPGAPSPERSTNSAD